MQKSNWIFPSRTHWTELFLGMATSWCAISSSETVRWTPPILVINMVIDTIYMTSLIGHSNKTWCGTPNKILLPLFRIVILELFQGIVMICSIDQLIALLALGCPSPSISQQNHRAHSPIDYPSLSFFGPVERGRKKMAARKLGTSCYPVVARSQARLLLFFTLNAPKERLPATLKVQN